MTALTTPDVPTIHSTVSAYFAALGSLDCEAWLEVFAPDAIVHDPAGSPALEGREALRQFVAGLFTLFESIRMTQDHVFVSGASAAVKWSAHCVGKNGRRVNTEGIDVFEMNAAGKVQRMWGYWNPAELLERVAGEV